MLTGVSLEVLAKLIIGNSKGFIRGKALSTEGHSHNTDQINGLQGYVEDIVNGTAAASIKTMSILKQLTSSRVEISIPSTSIVFLFSGGRYGSAIDDMHYSNFEINSWLIPGRSMEYYSMPDNATYIDLEMTQSSITIYERQSGSTVLAVYGLILYG